MLLAHGSDYTIPRDSDVTALHIASYNGDLAIVEHLLNFAAKKVIKEQLLGFIDQRNYQGKTALWDAVGQNRPHIIQLLLEHGADYTIPRKSGVTVLYRVCFAGDIILAKTLLDFVSRNATEQQFHDFINQRNNDLETALVDACQNGGPHVTGILLDHGADYTIPDTWGFTALHYCAWRNRGPTVHILLDKTAPDSTSSTSIKSKFSTFLNRASTPNRRTALCDVACQNFTHLVRELLEIGADWDCSDNEGRTPAHWACRHGNGEMYKLLVAAAGFDGVGSGKGELKGEERRETEERFHDRRDKDGESVSEAALRKGIIKNVEMPNGKA